MTYYKKSEYKLIGFEKSNRKNKMYNGVLERKTDKKIVHVPFGDNRYSNFRDLTGLNLYPHLIHGDDKRRRLYKIRHQKDIKDGYYSAGYFSYFFLW